MSRPFGVAMLMAGVDLGEEDRPSAKGAQLFHLDPSGTYLEYDAKAIGAGAEWAQQTLQEKYDRTMSLQDACKLAAEVLKLVMEEKINSSNVEIALLTPDTLFRLLSKEELDAIIKQL